MEYPNTAIMTIIPRRLSPNRFGFLYQDLVPVQEVVGLLAAVFSQFKHERQPGESFGDFCFRKGPAALAITTKS